jgi:hypothetical protein
MTAAELHAEAVRFRAVKDEFAAETERQHAAPMRSSAEP